MKESEASKRAESSTQAGTPSLRRGGEGRQWHGPREGRHAHAAVPHGHTGLSSLPTCTALHRPTVPLQLPDPMSMSMSTSRRPAQAQRSDAFIRPRPRCTHRPRGKAAAEKTSRTGGPAPPIPFHPDRSLPFKMDSG